MICRQFGKARWHNSFEIRFHSKVRRLSKWTVSHLALYTRPGFVWERLLFSCYFPLKVARWRLSPLNIGLACTSDPSALSRKALILAKVCVCKHVVKKHTSGPNTSPASHGRSGCGRLHAWLWSDVILRFGRNFNSGRCL
ncbi:hypothetical protein, unlikely [Trypanosoma congolense IL3000]|uniref:Uncharacterized protein n=1 Tax=Trypanosoma congolense (strain IL3000) TaxID=1068625 RepID=F9WBU5_TRYCI|nr:hypothetical protein, unlikely [Trypanosoma congolense IL3000]